jgi:hypothetical protein
MNNFMKIRSILILFILFTGFANAGVLELHGVYQGKNLYVQNPFAANMKDFCTNEVSVNGVVKMTGIQSSAYEIDLSDLKLQDPVTIKITHKDDCKPKVLNPTVIRPSSTFQFSSFNVDKDHLFWASKGEKPKGRFFVEQYVNTTWVIVKELHGKESPLLNNYDAISTHHSGLNKYRVKYLENDGQVFYSSVMEFTSELPPLEIYPKRVSDKVYFNPSREADFEVLDAYGNVVRKGKGKDINMEDLPSGVYYINLDNKTYKIFKK